MNDAPSLREVPYEDIDVEIRKLVWLLNGVPGIKTIGSCAGHELGEEAEIDFEAGSQEALSALLGALPFVGWRGGISNNFPHSSGLYVNVFPQKGDRPLYKLRIAGSPFYVQRELLGRVEEALCSYFK